jgi:hypothetical protein
MQSRKFSMTDSSFSFADLEDRLQKIPEGPAGVLNTPLWIFALNVLGWIGVVAGLAPSLLVKVMSPAQWMVLLAKGGLWLALLSFAPGFVRNIILIGYSMFRWRKDQVAQMDHDLLQFHDLRRWLAQFSISATTDALRFVRQNQARLTAKVGLLAGAIEKLGIFPGLLAVVIQIKAYSAELGATPAWQVVLAMFLAGTYLIALVVGLMRLRLQLYEMVLIDSLAARGVEPTL